MKKAFVFLYVTILLALTGCKAELPRLESVPNSSSNPTVVAPSASGGSIHFHRWQEATCTQPKTCSICGKTKGVATGHIYNNNATCYICGQEKRENEKKEYEIIAVFKTVAYTGFKYYQYNSFNNQREFETFIKKCRELSFYNIEKNINYGEKLITLSTCEYSQENGRLVVIAKEIL